ncbi:MAG: Ketose-bisphosphate aldolase, class-II [Parcubacteria group bacterium GW2011_GWA1_47_8]|nr:MAG: Ketose-bisphosphate aldolase, class-II [Parcubacteria group bacterium GW2011_GWA1_47_8]KKW07045.1 MAG: Ketose-bisphosphate aldolase, class-II [Parcubacteria group bacterium GW2011_GWA2_49_16]
MPTLREVIADAGKKHIAVGHFNISDMQGFWGVVKGARAVGVPVIIGVSEGERDFIGVRQVAALVKTTREELNYPIYLNADHSYSFERVKEAIDAGFDAVIFDGAKLSFEENARIAKQCVDYARSINPEILVEAELGYIGTSSKILDAIPEGVSLENLTTPEEAERFVRETGIDFFAPSVGNIHGMLRNIPEPRLNIERIKEIRKAAGVPLVLHGGSGTSDEDFTAAIKAGIGIVHINTEIRVAYRDALKRYLTENSDEIAPYKFMKSSVNAIAATVEKRLRLFSHSIV